MISLSKVGKSVCLCRYMACANGFLIEWQQNVNRSGELVGTGGFCAKTKYVKKGYSETMQKRIFSYRENYLGFIGLKGARSNVST